MLTVHVRINDAGTGQPTPVRLRLRSPAGTLFPPFGRLASFATAPGIDVGGQLQLGPDRFFFVEGSCEVRLPAGPLRVEARKGPEYLPFDREVTLSPGKISLRLAIERWTDLRAEGWYSGDVRATYLTPHAALLEAAAEDVAVVNLLAHERPPEGTDPPALANVLAFSGTVSALAKPGYLVAVNTLNTHPVLGSVALLNCHRVVYPLRFGGPDLLDDWSVLDWCEQCHRKSGLVVWPDLPRWTEEHPQGEALAAVLLGQVDAYEVSTLASPEPPALVNWYRLLNCGRRLPLVGGSGKDSNTRALGRVRTYARLEPGEELSYAAWIKAVRAGRTFVTNGPLLFLTVDGQGSGALLAGEGSETRVRVRVEARSGAAIEQLQILVNGQVQGSKSATADGLSILLESEVSLKESAWIAARCWGRQSLPDDPEQSPYAHTSPVYVQLAGQPLLPTAETLAPLLRVLDQTEEWVRRQANCPTEKERAHLVEVLTAARRACAPGPTS